MKMIRDWNGDTHHDLLDILEKFDVSDTKLRLIKFEIVSPDSFIWFIAVNNQRYCLYAEDFVQSLEDVLEAIHANLPENEPHDNYQLVPVKNPEKWTESTPVTQADISIPPEDQAEFMRYAATSGYDFVFLAKSIN